MPRFSCRFRKASSALPVRKRIPKGGDDARTAGTTRRAGSRSPLRGSSCRRNCRNSNSGPRKAAASRRNSSRNSSNSSNKDRAPREPLAAGAGAAVAVREPVPDRGRVHLSRRRRRKRGQRRLPLDSRNRPKRVVVAGVDVSGGAVAAAMAAPNRRPARFQRSAVPPELPNAAAGSAASDAPCIRRSRRSGCSNGRALPV